ncbi:RICIN domain-containing protein [Dyella sp.]|uniref:RICIN domain-containing protein n=1 Tax=Dyella sp. TaxID=1869338 RepID=UPI002ED23096
MRALKRAHLAFMVAGYLSTGTAFSYTADHISVVALKDLPTHVTRQDSRPAVRTTFDAIVRPVTAAQGLEQDVAWVPARLLGHRTRGDEVRALLSNGVPVLITREPGEDSSNALEALFGVSMDADAAIYYRDHDGTLRILAAEPLHYDASDGTRLTHLTQALAKSMPAPPSRSALPTLNSIPIEVPHLAFAATELYPDGGAITISGTATRSSSLSSDAKVITMKTRFIAPAQHYSFTGGGFPQLVIPSNYRLSQTIQAFTTTPLLLDRFPYADSRTDVTLSEQRTTSTSYGFSISPELENGLQSNVRATSAKLPFGFEFGKYFDESTSVSITLKDYQLNTSARDNGQMQYLYWDVALAPFILNTRGYFGGPFNTSPSRVTPMMKGLDSEVFSTWILPGSFEDSIRLTSIYEIDYHRFAEPRTPTHVGKERPNIATAVSIKGKSPFLSREVTALIRSTSNNGCLTASSDSDIISLQPCDTALDNYAQQWNLDSEQRYRNRMDGRCMAVSDGDHVKLTPCTLDLNQRFRWVAERIHSLRDGDNQSLRLYSHGQDIHFEATAANTLPPNPFHELMSPWSSYPNAPRSSDIVPDPLPRLPRAVPEEWVTQYGAVPANERWDVVVLRQGM